MRVIKIDTPRGVVTLPLIKVAEHRALCYTADNPLMYDDEVEEVMEDDYEGIDWLVNNTDYEDWTEHIEHYSDEVNVTDDEFWCSTEGFEIVEIDE